MKPKRMRCQRRPRVRVLALSIQAFMLVASLGGFIGPRRALADGQTPLIIDLSAAGSSDVTVTGAVSGDHINIVSVADVNGDGVDDLVIATNTGSSATNPRTSSGAVYVVFGGVGLTDGTAVDLSSNPPDVTILGATSDDRFGTSLVTGDVNGDGIPDIIIGAPRARGLTDADTFNGRVYVIFGGPQLTPGTVRDMAGIEGSGADMVIVGASANDHLGSALALGDINGDGLSDIIIGAADASPEGGSRPFAGTIYTIFGNRNLVNGTARDLSGQTAPGADLMILGPSILGFFGFQMAVADVNGDGLSDIIVTAPLGDGPNGSRFEAGELYVVFGDPALANGGVRDMADLNIAQRGAIIYGANSADLFGFSVAAADVTGDGVADIIVGAVQSNGPDGTRSQAGEVDILFGGATLRQGTIRDVSGQIGAGADVRIFGADAGDALGTSLATADVDGDHIADLFVGAPGAAAAANAKTGAGEVYVFLNSGISTTGTVRDVGGDPSQQPEVIIYGATAGDGLGSYITIGDVNGDGDDDWILSASNAGSTRATAGTIFILFGPRV